MASQNYTFDVFLVFWFSTEACVFEGAVFVRNCCLSWKCISEVLVNHNSCFSSSIKAFMSSLY